MNPSGSQPVGEPLTVVAQRHATEGHSAGREGSHQLHQHLTRDSGPSLIEFHPELRSADEF